MNLNRARGHAPRIIHLLTTVAAMTVSACSSSSGTSGLFSAPASDITGSKKRSFIGVDAPLVTGMTLVNTDLNEDVGTPLHDGDSITVDLSRMATFSFRAETVGTVGSVRFDLDGAYFNIQRTVPYGFNGDHDTLDPWSAPANTAHVIKATAFRDPNGIGTGQPVTINVIVVQSGMPYVSTPSTVVGSGGTEGQIGGGTPVIPGNPGTPPVSLPPGFPPPAFPPSLPPAMMPPEVAAYSDSTCAGLATDGWQRDAAGWTIFPQNASAIYVSSSVGNDSNPGTSESTPVRSLSKAVSLGGNTLLLKSGDVWDGQFPTGNLVGASQQSPRLISSYGSGPRPRIRGGLVARGMSNLAIVGLHFDGSATAAGSRGIGLISGSASNILLEDVIVEKFSDNMTFEATTEDGIRNVMIRRSMILDAYARNSAHSQGIYTDHVAGFTIEDSVLDHNGWKTRGGSSPATMFNHNVYFMSTGRCLVFRNNLTTRASATGIQARAGGVIEGNYFGWNPIGLTYGLVNGGSVMLKKLPMGVDGRVRGNLFLDNADIDSSNKRGNAVELGNIRKVLFSDNVIARHTSDNLAWGLALSAGLGLGVHNVKVDNNVIMDMKTAILTTGSAFGPVTVRNDGSLDPQYNNTATVLIGTRNDGADIYDASGTRKLTDSINSGIAIGLGTAPVTIEDAGIQFTNNSIGSVNKVSSGSKVFGQLTQNNSAPVPGDDAVNFVSRIFPAVASYDDLIALMKSQNRYSEQRLSPDMIVQGIQQAFR